MNNSATDITFSYVSAVYLSIWTCYNRKRNDALIYGTQISFPEDWRLCKYGMDKSLLNDIANQICKCTKKIIIEMHKYENYEWKK